MMAIAFLFVRMLGDCFKSRQRLEAEILVLRHQLNVCNSARHAGSICTGPGVPCSFGSIVAVSCDLRLSCVGIKWVLPLTGDGSPAPPGAGRGSAKRYAISFEE